MKRITPDIERVRRDILRMSEFVSSEEPGYTRISFSKEDREARAYVAHLMKKEADLSVRIDAAGNLIGTRRGETQKPVVLVGSHIDTVRGGGRFDGVSGVIAAIEIARRFEEEEIPMIHPLEVIVFLAEEPSPFGISTVGSRAMTGKLSEDLLSSLKDSQGRTLGGAIEGMGGNPSRIGEAERSPAEVLAFLELHIEQGPILYSRRIPIGAVTGIVGILRGRIEVVGRMDHAGTIPMEARKDGLVAGSEAVLALEKVCRELEGVVGTIGKIEVFPNSLNVIPGRVNLGMEVRSLNEGLLHKTERLFRKELDRVVEKRGVEIHFDSAISSKPVLFHPRLVEQVARVCGSLGISYLEMPSGAGHDANHLAEVVPTGMIFVPSKDGRSHCPEEWTDFEQVCLGAEVLANMVTSLDKEAAH
jgi:N-carbamoyl-L-amino-acid hydrolase